MAAHACLTLTTDIKVYFCKPQKPWQRGTIGKTNGLPGQYFPKGIDLLIDSQTQLNDIARVFHQRTRNTLNYETPAQRCGQCVASTYLIHSRLRRLLPIVMISVRWYCWILFFSPSPNIGFSDAHWAQPMHRIFSVFNSSCAYETGAHVHDECMLMVPEHGLQRLKDQQKGRTTSVAVYTNVLVDAVAPTMPQAQGTPK